MLPYTSITSLLRFKTGVVCVTILLAVFVFFSVRGQTKKEKPDVDISAPILFYPLPIKNLRGLIESTGKGRQRIASVFPLNPDFAKLEFNPLSAPICAPNENIGLLIPIKSAVGNYLRRATIRAMWANENYLKHSKTLVKYAFFVGVGQFNGSYPPQLLDEIKLNHDLVLVEYIETYRNNTFKTMAMMKWAAEYCPNHEFVITIDDDVCLSITNLMRFLQRRLHNYPHGERDAPSVDSKYRLALSPDEFLYAGYILHNTSPIRSSSHPKAGISWNDYPFEKYPDYANGAIVIYTRKTYRYIYLAASFVKYLDIDDVFIGIVAGKLGIKAFVLNPYVPFRTSNNNETAIGITRHGNPEDLLQYWMKPHNDIHVLNNLTSY